MSRVSKAACKRDEQGYPEVPAVELEIRKVIDPWNPRQGRTT